MAPSRQFLKVNYLKIEISTKCRQFTLGTPNVIRTQQTTPEMDRSLRVDVSRYQEHFQTPKTQKVMDTQSW